MLMHLPIQINGETRPLHVDPDRTLLSVLRDDLGLTGTKYGCGEGRCGACTVLVDGNPVQSCRITAGAAAGSRIVTVEGLEKEGTLHPLQEAFLETGALQCGYCTPGMIMSAIALSHASPQPSAAEITNFMQDHICRCGSYQRIVAAIAQFIQRSAVQHAKISGSAIPECSDVQRQDLPLSPDDIDEGIFVAYADLDLAAKLYGEGVEPPTPEERTLPEIGPWVHIDGEGAITVHVGKAEVGQNIRTSLAQIVAEEVRVPVSLVRVVMGDTACTPYDVGTFGSRSTPITGSQLWRAGAATREVLLDLAAADWNVARDTLRIADGTVRHPESGRVAEYGQLARDRYILRVASNEQPVTPAEAWTVAGQSVPKTDGRAFVTGEHRYAADMMLPEMVHGKILRPPAFYATLDRIDTSAAEVMEGVTVVRDGDFVGVTAADELSATRAVEAIRASWRTTMQVSQPEIFDYLKANPVEPEGRQASYPPIFIEGSIREGLAAADLTRQQRYTVDYIAHVPLEPRAALAQWEGDRLTVWTGTQRPFGVRSELALAFAIPEDHVRVVVPDTGAGYGGKHAGDAAIEAARLSKAVGKPVKIVWTRQEEFTWAYFRPAGLIEITSGVDKDGHLTALELHNYNSGAAGIESRYTVPHRHSEFHPADSPLRQGAYRALSSTANHFARETHMDELAHELGIEPLEFRYRNLADPRMRAVLAAAAEAFGWGKNAPAPHHGYGIAGGYEKGSYVAACAEVYVNPANGQPKVVRVVEAFDCGAILNPDNLRIQIEGAVVQGLGGALFESIKFANGRILNANFAGYRVPRFGDMPVIETILLDRKEFPSVGAGETPIIAIAPAIGNAIFQATGVRLRSLPLAPHGVQKEGA
jgi:nicotinate dehydrogenase subunit B